MPGAALRLDGHARLTSLPTAGRRTEESCHIRFGQAAFFFGVEASLIASRYPDTARQQTFVQLCVVVAYPWELARGGAWMPIFGQMKDPQRANCSSNSRAGRLRQCGTKPLKRTIPSMIPRCSPLSVCSLMFSRKIGNRGSRNSVKYNAIIASSDIGAVGAPAERGSQ